MGTTGVKLAVFDGELKRIHYERVELGYEPAGGGRVEQSSAEMARVVRGFARKARSLGARRIGLSTYRASVVAWSKSGEPLTNIVTWIDGRGREVVERLPAWVKLLEALSPSLAKVLRPDTPAVLMKWLYDNVPGLREKVERGDAYLWTLDSYLVYLLTGRYASDATSSALTGLVHPRDLEPIGAVFGILSLPEATPEIVDSVHEFGEFEGADVAVSIADQQAASVYHGLLEPGRVSGVHGTGSFVEESTPKLVVPGEGLVPVVIASLDGRRFYGAEGFLRASGLVVEWLRGAGFFSSYEEMESLASKAKPRAIVVPSFRGLRTPDAPLLKGMILGLDPSTTKADVVAGLAWGVALYVAYLLGKLSKYCGSPREPLWSGGGYSRSNAFLQALADATGLRVARPRDVESSIRGVLKLLLYSEGKASLDDLKEPPEVDAYFEPRAGPEAKALVGELEELLEVVARWEENAFLSGRF